MKAPLPQISAHPGESRNPGVFGLLAAARTLQKKAWVPAFAGMSGLLLASPALAHHDDEHGLPGPLHPLSADHLGWIVLAAVVLLAAFALRRPILKALKVRSRK